jgi:hypothetical protein
MAVEIFYAPKNGIATLTPEMLQAALRQVSLWPKVSEEDGLLWLEFDGFESRLLTTVGEAPLDLITLQLYDDQEREEDLTEKLEALLETLGYCDAEDLAPDEDQG